MDGEGLALVFVGVLAQVCCQGDSFLRMLVSKGEDEGGGRPVKEYNDCYDAAGWDDVAPIVDYYVAGNDLEGDECGFEDEETVAGGHAGGFVDVAAGEADEG